MNPEEAHLILHCRRPCGRDDADPVIAEALACVQSDPAAHAALEENTLVDRALSAHLCALPVPAGLRGNILAGKRLGEKPRRVRPLTWLSAAAAVVIAAPLAWKFWPGQDGQVVFASTTLSEFRHAAAQKLTKHDFELKPAASMAELKDRLKEQTPSVPESLCHCPGGIRGCHVFKWNGSQVTLICFNAGDDHGTVHLFTVDAAIVRDTPNGQVCEVAGDWNTLAWTCPCSGKVMLLAGEEGRTTAQDLQKLIAATQ